MVIGILCLVVGVVLIVLIPRLSLAWIQSQRELYEPLMRSGNPGRMRNALGGLFPELLTYEDGSRKERVLRAIAGVVVALLAIGFIAVGIKSL